MSNKIFWLINYSDNFNHCFIASNDFWFTFLFKLLLDFDSEFIIEKNCVSLIRLRLIDVNFYAARISLVLTNPLLGIGGRILNRN